MTQEEKEAIEAAEKAKQEAAEEKTKKAQEKADQKAAAEKAKQESSPLKAYEEYSVSVTRNDKGEPSFEQIKKLRGNVKLEPFRVDILNEQSINTKTRFYEQK
ncbi:hypothetical protein D3C72_1294660 [compost metagenome]